MRLVLRVFFPAASVDGSKTMGWDGPGALKSTCAEMHLLYYAAFRRGGDEFAALPPPTTRTYSWKFNPEVHPEAPTGVLTERLRQSPAPSGGNCCA